MRLGGEAAMKDSDVRVGHRVCASNAKGPQIGTVRYMGAVEGHEGIWVGVDWDNGEGRHDGSVNGVRYFETKHERSGSFVRPRNLSPGVSLLDALSLRYKTGAAPESEQGATTLLCLYFILCMPVVLVPRIFPSESEILHGLLRSCTRRLSLLHVL